MGVTTRNSWKQSQTTDQGPSHDGPVSGSPNSDSLSTLSELEEDNANSTSQSDLVEEAQSPRSPPIEIVAASGTFSELLLHPEHLIAEVGTGFIQARAVHIAVESRVADVLATAEHDNGMSAEDIGAAVGIDPLKLGTSFHRSGRCLTQYWIS